MNLGENIKNARKAAGVTQKELAERLQVYPKDISRWENGERTPSAVALGRICRELNASADEILELQKNQNERKRKNMNNTIILQEGYERLTKDEMKTFEKGGTIWGITAIRKN